MWTLSDLAAHVAHTRPRLTSDSRAVTPGAVFVAVPGSKVDGSRFIPEALTRGAAFVVCEALHAATVSGATAVVTDTPRQALAVLAAALHGTAALPFGLVGVTGTNGKTTCTYLLEHLFASAGKRAGVIGTIAQRWPGHHANADMTTPDCVDLHAMLADMAHAGVDMAAMEVSSHALDQCRVDEVPFAGAVFTNLTQDHLDYHQTFEAYYAAKARLFLEKPRAGKAKAVCTDAPWGQRLATDIVTHHGHSQLITFGLQPSVFIGEGRHVHGTMLESSCKGLHLRMDMNGTVWDIRSPLVGAFNAENLLAVQTMGLGLGFTPEQFTCFETFQGVCGRLERIPNPQGLDVFVDYAHTPDALTNVLTALRGAGFARIVCVFGCGGNRDRTKRPLMGEAVARDADVAVLTSDNPRHEDPNAIMADVRPGLATAREVVCNADRRAAIAQALSLLRPGDALLVAGKGHETTQQIGDVKHPFSDQQTIWELLHAPQS